MPDPRDDAKSGAEVSVVGFYGSHHNAMGNSKVDSACNATFLGNWWTPAHLNNFAPPDHISNPHSFMCSEAGYWACQWWSRAGEFEGLNGQEVFEHALMLIKAGVPQDPSWGGFGNSWRMMIAILRKKFTSTATLAAALISTGDAYLVEHQEGYDSDNTWSDFCDGSGSNWLGLNLMRVRDELVSADSGARVGSNWTTFIDTAYDPSSGGARSGKDRWSASVRAAAGALNVALPYECPNRTSLILV